MRWHRFLPWAAVAALSGCGGPVQRPVADSGTVTGVYVEAAPGLYVERRLAAASGGPLVADVSLAAHPARREAVRVAAGVPVDYGDTLAVAADARGPARTLPVVAASGRPVPGPALDPVEFADAAPPTAR